jgi:uncharacterized membrane protein YoaK (UPF0700 family)
MPEGFMPNQRPAGDGPLPLVLIGLTGVTGLVDAVSYLGLGRVFVANMTGNVVFLGFLSGGVPGFSAVLSLLAIVAFVAGAIAAGRLVWSSHGHRGRLLAASCAIQALVVGGALLVSLVSHGARGDAADHALVVLLAFAMGLQTATARRLGVADLSTTVLTMTVTGLAADSHFAGGVNPNAGRRLATAMMFLGAFVGAVFVLHFSMSGALALTTALLLSYTIIAAYRWSSSTEAWTAVK